MTFAARVRSLAAKDQAFTQVVLPISLLIGILAGYVVPTAPPWLAHGGVVVLALVGWWGAQFRGWGLLAACVLSGWVGHHTVGWYLDDFHLGHPEPRHLKAAYQIQGRFLNAVEGEYGCALYLDRIEVLSPANTPFRIDRLTVYVPPPSALPRRGSLVTAWIRLQQRTQPHPIPWPMQTLRESLLPSLYGSVKDEKLWSFEEAARPWSPALSLANRELIAAMIDGAPSRIWYDRLEPFGVGHLLAISGQHCLLVFFAVQLLLFPIRRPWVRVVATSVALFLFTHWVGWTASVTRSALMWIGWTCLPSLNRIRSGIRLWMGLLLMALLLQPELLLLRGFWYSYGACLGLIAGQRLLGERASPLEHPWLARLRPYLPIVAAQMFVVPISLMFEGYSRFTSLFWNMMGLLFMVVLCLLFVLAVIAHALPFLVEPVNGLEEAVAYLLQGTFSGDGFVELVRFPQHPVWVVACLAGMALLLRFGPREKRWYGALACLALFCLLGRPLSGEKLVLLDVGQGSCLLHVDEEGRGILYDAGGKLPPPLRIDRLARLWGAETLDAAFVSHLDLDHYQLLEKVPRRFPLKVPVSQLSRFEKTEMLAGFELIPIQAGARDRWGDLDIEVLWPRIDREEPPNDNEGSLVLGVQGSDFWMLLTGDAGIWMEQRLTLPQKKHGTVLLQVGHHGSKSATGAAFLDTLKPEIALISCGLHNRFSHPNEGVVKRLAEREIDLYQTSKLGSLVLSVDSRLNKEMFTGQGIDMKKEGK